MMRILVLSLLMALCSAAGFAQKAVSAAESKTMIERVCQAASKIETLQCDFRQTKHLTLMKTDMRSVGKMHYKGGRQLRWEYTSPYAYTFVLSGGKVTLKSQKKTDVINVSSSKMFQQIARIMMNSVTGQCLKDKKDFRVTMLTDGGEWLARLVPLQKEMAQMFSSITLHINPKSQMVTKVDMLEKSGDKTVIEMLNVKKNSPVSDAVFNVK